MLWGRVIILALQAHDFSGALDVQVKFANMQRLKKCLLNAFEDCSVFQLRVGGTVLWFFLFFLLGLFFFLFWFWLCVGFFVWFWVLFGCCCCCGVLGVFLAIAF